MKQRSLAGWIFAGPSLLVIGVFFGLPVLSALALSITDFDLYALADGGNLRFVGLGNYIDLLQTPMFHAASKPPASGALTLPVDARRELRRR